ncbi:uncharacterized protein CDV56_109634 [Aspergillus thermomutatus]|uniref:Cell pattern formation-associated protein STUA n=1 Tax=Aspergillus thermomutatus TaxID=41047 RepID=A0A397HYA6_ASPTH|nr:uncharacterized protein CDV56_109634 [Aspergillus thermomutatus]RHZ67757.1 hypothetical protein CDV56_109634 [Aspergillus thermomutatus]
MTDPEKTVWLIACTVSMGDSCSATILASSPLYWSTGTDLGKTLSSSQQELITSITSGGALIGAIPALMLGAAMPRCPETPRQLISHSRVKRHGKWPPISSMVMASTYPRISHLHSANGTAVSQLGGFNTLMYYSATLFAMVGFNKPAAVSMVTRGPPDYRPRNGKSLSLVVAAIAFHWIPVNHDLTVVQTQHMSWASILLLVTIIISSTFLSMMKAMTPSGARRSWIMDPIDGTAAFIQGQQYAVSVALVEGGEQKVGVVGYPNLAFRSARVGEDDVDREGDGMMLAAVKGHGAWTRRLTRSRLEPAEPLWPARSAGDGALRLADSLASPFIAVKKHLAVRDGLGIAEETVTDLWSMQVKYAALAIGACDVMIWIPKERDFHPYVWDHAGGMLVYEESGGKITDLRGKAFDFGMGRQLSENFDVPSAPLLLHFQTVTRQTEKLELPSISQVHTRGPVDIPWYNHHAAERPLLSGDKLPALSLPTASQPIVSGQSYRASYEESAPGSTSSSARTSLSSGTAPTVSEARTPPPSVDLVAGGPGRLSLESSAPQDYTVAQHPVSDSYYPNPTPLGSMNQTQSYMDVHSSHLSSTQPYASQAATAGAMAHYPQYHQQPPVLQPASTYGPASSYSQYAYPGGVASTQPAPPPPTTSMSSQVPAQLLPLPVNSHTVTTPGYGNTTGTPMQGFVYDTSGQLAPPGAKPRVTATLWEDEGSLCYQVEAKGVCVARREDNHMINGTKLLNVAGMTRGRRDGILKSEKVRHVVKIGPMHLKGVWIPFERALEFANKEKITDLLYPLFVHNIGGLLYHPTNQTRTNMVVQESQQRRLEGPPSARTPQASQPPALHHHHSMQNPIPSQMPQPPTMSSQPGARPTLDRAHTFPTPPASASSLMGISNQSSSYDWNNQGMNSGVPNTQPLSIDTTLSNARSMPTTPATTPPGNNNLQGMQSYQSQSGYDSSKPYYSTAPSSHPHYAPQHHLSQYGQTMPPHSYIKNEMAPPAGRAPGGQSETETSDVKPVDRYSQSNGHIAPGAGESGPEHESDYVHHDNAGYGAARSSYTYTTNPSVGSLTGEHSQLTTDITGSPQQNGSGRMTPRTSGGPPPQWASGYASPPRPIAASSLYNIVSDTRGTSANGTGSDNYTVTSNSAPTYSTMGGSLGSSKRGREDDDLDRMGRPDSQGEYESKRRRTITEATVGGPVGGVPLGLQPMKAGGAMPRRR